MKRLDITALTRPADALTITAFRDALPDVARVFGLDVGTKTIGIALSDVLRQIASPLDTIRRTKFTADAALLLQLAEKFEIHGFIVGLPVNLDGSEGPRAQSTRAFARNLAALTTLPLAFWDERLSTVAAGRALMAGDASRKRRAAVIDQTAAAIILQGALDRMNYDDSHLD